MSEDFMPNNVPYLDQCYGFRIGKTGIKVHNPSANVVADYMELHYSWPFPQFIRGKGYNILVVRDATAMEDLVYSISDDYLTITHIFTIDELTFGRGGLMEVADFGSYLYMTNGVIMIYWDYDLDTWHQVTEHDNIPMMKTICNLNGQAFGGNVISDWYDCDEKYYLWSKIGSMDFTPDKRNESGYRRDPYGGEVLNVRSLRNSVIGFSTKGITAFTPVREPAATFSTNKLSEIGLINQGAVDGDADQLVYVGRDLRVRRLNKEGIEDLGYHKYMEELEDEDIKVMFEPQKKDFYIGNSSKTYLLSPYGLSEIKQHPSAVWWDAEQRETYVLPDAVDDAKPYLCTWVFDMGLQAWKTVFTMETNMLFGSSPEAGVDWVKGNASMGFGEEVYKPLNDMGVASIVVAGNAFRFRLRFSELFESSWLSSLKVRYKMTDMRGIRGIYAPGIRGQSEG